MKKWLCLLLGVCIQSNAGNSIYLKKTFIHKGDTLHYRVILPENVQPNKNNKVPLVIFLHGAGERGNDNEKQLTHGAALFADSINRSKYPAIVIFPQCPADKYWVSVKERKNGNFIFNVPQKPELPLELVYKLIQEYIKNPLVDKKRVYISGLSMGGMGTYDLICRHPKMFAAAVPICGAVNVERLKKARKMAIRIYHGSQDEVVSVEHSRNAYIELKANGAEKVEFFEFPGVGHNSWESAFAHPDFLEWLFSNRK